jgi:hypothetical protein
MDKQKRLIFPECFPGNSFQQALASFFCDIQNKEMNVSRETFISLFYDVLISVTALAGYSPLRERSIQVE